MSDVKPELIGRALTAAVKWAADHGEMTSAGQITAAISAVADDLRAEGAERALLEAADEVEGLYFGPDQHTPFTRGAAHLWGAKQAGKRLRARADQQRRADQ